MPSFTPADREVAYEQNVAGLEIAWRERIERFAKEAVDSDADYAEASGAVAQRLLNSERWQNVAATDVSDIAYEAVNREIDARRS